MEIAEIQSGTLTLQKETIDFGALVQTTTQKWRDKMAAKNLEFEIAIENVPQTSWVTPRA